MTVRSHWDGVALVVVGAAFGAGVCLGVLIGMSL